MGKLNVRNLIVVMVLFLTVAAYSTSAGNLSGAVDNAFRNGNPGALGQHLSNDRKVSLSIPQLGIKPGSYSRQQVLALLRQAFSEYRTVSFSQESSRGAIKANWSVRNKTNGKVKNLTLYVSSGGSGSVITSIRGG